MGTAGAIRAGKAFVELFADDGPLTKGLKTAEGKLQKWGSKVTDLGKSLFTAFGALSGAGIAGLVGAAKTFGDMGGALVDLSDKTGMGIEQIQELGYAAQQTGANLGTVEVGIKKMQDTIANATAGNEQAVAALARLGVSVNDLAGLNPDKQMALLADGIAKITDPALRTAAALDVFGKSGTDLIPMMKDGAAGLEKYAAEARELGLVMSADDARAADDFGDTLGVLFSQMKMAVASIAAAFLPLLKGLVPIIQGVVANVTNWIRENKALIVSVGLAVAGVAAAGLAFMALGKAITIGGALIGAAATAISTAVAVVQGVVAGVIAAFNLLVAATAALAAGVSALASPLVIVAALLAAAAAAAVAFGAYWLVQSGKIGEAADWVKQKFSELSADAVRAWSGIKAALDAGDIGAAMKVVGALLKMEWANAVAFLERKWLEFKFAALRISLELGKGIADALIDAFGLVRKVWIAAEGELVKGVLKATLMLKNKRALTPDEMKTIDAGVNMATAVRNSGINADTAHQKGLAGAVKSGFDAALAGMESNALANLGDGGVGALREEFERLVAAAENLKNNPPGSGPGGAPPHGEPEEEPGPEAGAEEFSQSDKHKGVGALDIRTKEGFAPIAELLGGSGDPAFALQKRQFEEQRRTRHAIEQVTVKNFKK